MAIASGSPRHAAETRVSAPSRRLVGLDGIRGLAALFVMLHHCWLLSFPGYPATNGPLWSNWLVYGHFAVVIFIVLSGFSLAVSPARHDWALGGRARFAHRRAWRILPPYWAALAISLLIAWFVVTPAKVPDGKSVVIHALLLQDVFGSNTPNGAFWSIAIEAQLYLVFPLLLIVLRRAGSIAMLTGMTLVVVTVGALAPHVSLVDLLMRFTPQFAALFALGVVAAGILRAGDPRVGDPRVTDLWHIERMRRVPWAWVALAAVIPPVVLIAVKGSVWTVENFFWVDLTLGPAFGALLAAIALGGPKPLIRLLDTPPVKSLGSFSYSLYLIHAPIVVVVYTKLVAPRVAPGVPRFLAMLVVAAPLAILGARLFASVFELPFTRHRTWPELKAAILARVSVLTGRSAGRQAGELAAAVRDGALLSAQVHPVHGGPGPDPLVAGEANRP
jgi:peptidoglycan/LPS O-acetylase OafA/YrhL